MSTQLRSQHARAEVLRYTSNILALNLCLAAVHAIAGINAPRRPGAGISPTTAVAVVLLLLGMAVPVFVLTLAAVTSGMVEAQRMPASRWKLVAAALHLVQVALMTCIHHLDSNTAGLLPRLQLLQADYAQALVGWDQAPGLLPNALPPLAVMLVPALDYAAQLLSSGSKEIALSSGMAVASLQQMCGGLLVPLLSSGLRVVVLVLLPDAQLEAGFLFRGKLAVVLGGVVLAMVLADTSLSSGSVRSWLCAANLLDRLGVAVPPSELMSSLAILVVMLSWGSCAAASLGEAASSRNAAHEAQVTAEQPEAGFVQDKLGWPPVAAGMHAGGQDWGRSPAQQMLLMLAQLTSAPLLNPLQQHALAVLVAAALLQVAGIAAVLLRALASRGTDVRPVQLLQPVLAGVMAGILVQVAALLLLLSQAGSPDQASSRSLSRSSTSISSYQPATPPGAAAARGELRQLGRSSSAGDGTPADSAAGAGGGARSTKGSGAAGGGGDDSTPSKLRGPPWRRGQRGVAREEAMRRADALVQQALAMSQVMTEDTAALLEHSADAVLSVFPRCHHAALVVIDGSRGSASAHLLVGWGGRRLNRQNEAQQGRLSCRLIQRVLQSRKPFFLQCARSRPRPPGAASPPPVERSHMPPDVVVMRRESHVLRGHWSAAYLPLRLDGMAARGVLALGFPDVMEWSVDERGSALILAALLGNLGLWRRLRVRSRRPLGSGAAGDAAAGMPDSSSAAFLMSPLPFEPRPASPSELELPADSRRISSSPGGLMPASRQDSQVLASACERTADVWRAGAQSALEQQQKLAQYQQLLHQVHGQGRHPVTSAPTGPQDEATAVPPRGNGAGSGSGSGSSRSLALEPRQMHGRALPHVEFVRVIGRGGFSTVYEALWRGQRVAVKVLEHGNEFRGVLDGPADMDPGTLEKGLEQRAAELEGVMTSAISMLNHPNIVATLDFQEMPPPHELHGETVQPHSSNQTYIFLELCDRGSLQDLIDKDGFGMRQRAASSSAPDWSGLLATLLEVSNAMAYIHRLGIVHQDLKPKNILLQYCATDPRGFTAKVSDFGLSKIVFDGLKTHAASHHSGTITHMAPELIQHGKAHPAGDVYAFGLIMWELVSGRPPYEQLRPPQIMIGVVMQALRPIFPASTPAWYRHLACCCWDTDPHQRPRFRQISRQIQDAVLLLQREAS